jgi:hypothetical protein
VSAEAWVDVEEPFSGGSRPKLWVQRADDQRAIFKTPPAGSGPEAQMEVVASRFAVALGLSAQTTQLFDHETRGWGALLYELPAPYKNFQDMPEAVEIESGADRQTLSNDWNYRRMLIYDRLVSNADRHGANHMVSVELSRDAAPRRWRHYLVDHGLTLDAGMTREALEQAVSAAGGTPSYVAPFREPIRAALEYADARWWGAVEPFSRAFASSDPAEMGAILAQVPEGLLSNIHRDCALERIKQGQEVVEEFLSQKEAGTSANSHPD